MLGQTTTIADGLSFACGICRIVFERLYEGTVCRLGNFLTRELVEQSGSL